MGVAPDSELSWPLCAGKRTSCHAAGGHCSECHGGSEHVTLMAKDPVIVTPFDDGGLISYRKADGLFLHTLNTREGLERKLRQLGIR